jgi:NADH-quinone oxidoreductase subunit B
MLMDAILKLHDKILHTPLGPHRTQSEAESERVALEAAATHEMKGLLR